LCVTRVTCAGKLKIKIESWNLKYISRARDAIACVCCACRDGVLLLCKYFTCVGVGDYSCVYEMCLLVL